MPLSGLFDLLLNTKFIKLAGATKLVSPFRPRLIPVIDSVVENYYWFATSITDKESFRRLKQAAGWGEYVLVLLELIQRDVRGARTQIDRVRRACGNMPYARASRVRIVESLLWYYYARESGQTDDEVKER